MISVKPAIERDDIVRLLQEHFDEPIESLETLEGGAIAQTLAFCAGGQEYVIRFHAQVMGANFAKEAYIARHIEPGVPIPAFVHVGQVNDFPYAITRRAPGRPLISFAPHEVETYVPALLSVLDGVHGSHLPPSPGYGFFDDRGVGAFATWRESIAAVWQEDPEWDFYGAWHSLFDNSFLERDFFEGVYRRMLELLEFCPEERTLLHCGYFYSNLLVEDGKVTAVLDWIDSRYGDAVFDLAPLVFWDPQREIGERYLKRCEARGESVPHFRERLRCYMCYLGLDSLRFFAKTNDASGYGAVRDRLVALLGE
jgi:hygromycin-B 4-O-kinase